MNLFFKMDTQNGADDIIKNILQTGMIPNNLPYATGDRVTIKLTSFINVIERIKYLKQEDHKSQTKIKLLRSRIEELEIKNMYNMVCDNIYEPNVICIWSLVWFCFNSLFPHNSYCDLYSKFHRGWLV